MPSKATVSKEVAKTPRPLRRLRKTSSAVEPTNLLSLALSAPPSTLAIVYCYLHAGVPLEHPAQSRVVLAAQRYPSDGGSAKIL
jgi:hypothetical protein